MRSRPRLRPVGRLRSLVALGALVLLGCSLAMAGAPRPARAISQCVATIHCASFTIVPFGQGSGTVTSSDGVIACTVTGGAPSGTCAATFEWPATQSEYDVLLSLAPAAGSEACRSPNPVSCAPEGNVATATFTLQNGVASELDMKFDLALRTVTLTRSGEGTGSIAAVPASNPTVKSICPSICSVSFPYGSGVTLYATPDAGAAFAAWTGACAGQGGTCSLTLTDNVSTNAVFGLPTASPSPSPSPSTPAAGPTSSPPLIRLAASGTAGSTTVPGLITWGAMTAGSPLLAYQLQCRVSGGPWTDVALSSPLATSVSRALQVGVSTQCWVRAADAAGHTGAWATSIAVTPVATQESSSAIAYRGAWTVRASSSAWGGRTKSATAAAASATFRFSGSSVALVVPRGPAFGAARIYLDRTLVRTISLFASSARGRQVLYRASWGAVGSHTLTIAVVGTSGHPRFDIDGFAVLR